MKFSTKPKLYSPCMVYIACMLAILLVGCHKDEPIKPPDPVACTYAPGTSNLSWRIDTVGWWPSNVGAVWAFADNDVYAMGYLVNKNARVLVGMHWNGTQWEENLFGTPLAIGCYTNAIAGDAHTMVCAGYYSLGNEKMALAFFNNEAKTWTKLQTERRGGLYAAWTDGKGYFVAGGDSGTLYVKDGYGASWQYAHIPTSLLVYQLAGVSKTELYALAAGSVESTNQLWKFDGSQWNLLYDQQDTAKTNPIQLPTSPNAFVDLAVSRCNVTDSLTIYLIGWESYVVEGKGQSAVFRATNLSVVGLPLRLAERKAKEISFFSPSDYWIFGTRFNFYHWNGQLFTKVNVPGLPNDDRQFGIQRKMVKSHSGKIFFPTEINGGVFVVAQGIAL